MKSSSLPLHAPRPRQLVLALALALPMLSHAGVEIDQIPLTVGKPLEPNIWFILDDSASMARTYMPEGSGSGVDAVSYTRNTIYYNPHVVYEPWKNADGTLMPDASVTSVSTNANTLANRTNLTSAARCFHVPKNIVTGDTGNVSLYRWRLNAGGGTAQRCSASDSCSNNTGCTNVTEFSWTLPNGTTITRSIAEEWQNYANWYHYYRTRIKMAKASVTHAFSDVGEKFRVGYTSIWDVGTLDIPFTENNGLFVGANRNAWYENLLNATGHGSSTPLRVALGRAGDYFKTADPYKNSDGTELSCRQNFAILTTDGEWNESNSSIPLRVRGNHDGTDGEEIERPGKPSYTYRAEPPYADAHTTTTLADIAMYYWKNDLRPTENNVPTSSGNPAFWQHMRTFGVSIGMSGTLSPDMTVEELATVSWPNPTTAATKIDDLFHATVNTRGRFMIANDAGEFTKVLRDALGQIDAETGRSASGAASSTSVDIGTMTYFTQYTSGTWSGDVRGYAIDPSTGRVSTAPGSGWAASEVLPAWDARKIFFNKGGALSAFTWGNLSGTQRTALGSEAIVNYLRGDRSNEITDEVPSSGTLRPRDNPLGSFVNSQPVYVGKPPFSSYYENASTPGADSYKDHATSKASRIPVLYVGGNDGMLHGFNAETGVETFAFVPSSAISETLREYSNPEYEHHYFVDGELTVAEAYVGDTWRTILVGSLGRGGRGVFALDVTNPESVSLLWEKSATEIPALGNVIGKPIIAEVGSGSDWRAVFGNGPNGSGDKAQLISISLNDGSVSVIDTGEGGDNGLSAPLVWDADKNGTFETVYAGDLKGNVWRFNNIYEASPPTPFHLFTTDGNRPITASPWAAVNQRDLRTWVFVGTGQYLNETDRASTATQTWYGLIDENETIGGRATELVERSITATGTVGGRRMRTVESGSASQMVGKKGWYIDFTETGERMITPNMFYGSALIGTTFIPDGSDLCKPGGRSALWGIDPFTGASLRKKLFNNYGTLGGEFPGVLDDLKPILVGNPPVTISEEGERTTVVIHTDPEEEEEFTPPTGDAEGQSWREVVGE